ncbi:asparagine--tRNA ligase [Candidatus Karelsulcia muelleri]|uniref:asparagine--tRNA ligase n=1 Tax=Candidatus Karelsulcia muelleri TaxID=336810 RepID=UPI00216B06C2|nr:asparagine--tRNA ligase [Candidatus Karelsulcia muelleri]
MKLNFNSIKDIISNYRLYLSKKISIKGWVKHFRSNCFLIISDGSTIKNIQIYVDKHNWVFQKINIGVSLEVIGVVVFSKGKKQIIEIYANKIKIYGNFNPEDLQKSILQPKEHSFKKLREQAYLRFRTTIFSSIMRIRHNISFSIHKFFYKKNIYYINTPIITTYDTEGAGDMFRVTNNDNDFFGAYTYLTVSGQLQGEAAASGLGKIYTFGPTFRAEKSNTFRHLSEFWMIEPEMSFYELNNIMSLAEEFLKFIIKYVIKHCYEDLSFLEKNVKKNIFKILYSILDFPFEKISYTNAIKILKFSKNVKFIYPVNWGADLQSEHEKFLSEHYFNNRPIIIFNYPLKIKPFYMRINNDNKTVAAMDIIFPYIGEIIGGSQREERYNVLLKRMIESNLDTKSLWWYLNIRRFGSVPHSGFGLGFERLIQFITNISNIKDVIPFPRYQNNALF